MKGEIIVYTTQYSRCFPKLKLVWHWTGVMLVLLLLGPGLKAQWSQIDPHCLFASDANLPVGRYLSATVEEVQPKSHRDSVRYYTLKLLALQNSGRYSEAYNELQTINLDQRYLRYLPFSLYAGNIYYMSGHYMRAAKCYQSLLRSGKVRWACLEEKDSVELVRIAHTNLGSCYNMLTLLDSAVHHYELVDIHPENAVLMHNNLASIYLKQFNYAAALKHLNDIDLGANIPEEDLVLTKYNLLKVYTALRDEKLATKILESIAPGQYPYADTNSALTMVLDYYIAFDDTLGFALMVREHSDYLRDHGDIARFALALELEDFYGVQEWSGVKRIWRYWQTLFLSPEKAVVRPAFVQFWITHKYWIIAVLLSFGLGFLVRHITAGEDQNKNAYVTLLESSKNDLEKEFVQSLTLKESQVLSLLIKNLTTKEIATELRVSVSYAYNLRSTTRKKFMDIMTHVEFEDWLRDKMR